MIGSSINRQEFSGNGSITVGYPITFRYDSKSWIKVRWVKSTGEAVLLTEITDYLLTGDGKLLTGQLTTRVPIASTDTLEVLRDSVAFQDLSLPANTPLPPPDLEKALDRVVMNVQDKVSRVEVEELNLAALNAAAAAAEAAALEAQAANATVDGLQTELLARPTNSQLAPVFAEKADLTVVNAALLEKADALSTAQALAAKASIALVESKADASATAAALDSKAPLALVQALDSVVQGKAGTGMVNAALAAKVDYSRGALNAAWNAEALAIDPDAYQETLLSFEGAISSFATSTVVEGHQEDIDNLNNLITQKASTDDLDLAIQNLSLDVGNFFVTKQSADLPTILRADGAGKLPQNKLPASADIRLSVLRGTTAQLAAAVPALGELVVNSDIPAAPKQGIGTGGGAVFYPPTGGSPEVVVAPSGAILISPVSFAASDDSATSDLTSLAIGAGAYVSGPSTTAVGDSAVAVGATATAIGSYAAANGASATAFGSASQATGAEAMAAGFSTQAVGAGQMVVGANLVAQSTSPVIEVGTWTTPATRGGGVRIGRNGMVAQTIKNSPTPPTASAAAAGAEAADTLAQNMASLRRDGGKIYADFRDGGAVKTVLVGDGNLSLPTAPAYFEQSEKTKLSGIASGATANSADATLLDRANHTGTQSLDSISDSGAVAGQVATWNGFVWEPTTPTTGDVIGNNIVATWQANAGAATLSSLGDAALTTVGTLTTANVASTNARTSTHRVDLLVTVAAVNAIASFRRNVTKWFRSANDTYGGFRFRCVWGPSTGCSNTSMRAFVGMRAASTAPSDVEPSSQNNIIGMGWDSADTNVQIMHSAAGATTKINLGADFPVPETDNSAMYELRIDSPPNSSTVGWSVRNVATNFTVSGTISTALPAIGNLLAPAGYVSSGGVSAVVGMSFSTLTLVTK